MNIRPNLVIAFLLALGFVVWTLAMIGVWALCMGFWP